ncbi:MAG: M3 family metallopeptidase [Betaproteobacteria bacterium]|nr:M3 family metallopeptidase [Betaproteobacteria bacterium]
MNAPIAPQLLSNPLLDMWDTPFGLPPFARIDAAHFAPAFEVAMGRHRAEVDAIAHAAEPPSFANTVVALDQSGRLLSRVSLLFDNLCSSETSPVLQEVERDMAQPLAAHYNAIYLDAALFARIDAVHAARATLGLDAEQVRLVERVHLDFVRSGANLSGVARARYAAITERLAALTTLFAQNVLADESGFQLVLRGPAELAGLPPFLVAAAKEAAVERAITDADAHVITLSRSLVVPFLTFSTRRDLREKAYRAWTSRGEGLSGADKANAPLIREIMALRHEQATLLGYPNYAAYATDDTMARSPEAVRGLLDQVWEPAKARMAGERAALQAIADREAPGCAIEAWDWRFYAEKVRHAQYALDDAELKPYFSLDRMVEAAFDCATRLFGLTFTARPDIAAYHPDVRVYEVHAGGKLKAIFLHDNFARPTKRSGAWMSILRSQSNVEGAVVPIVLNNNNFAKGAPTLLSFDDVRTLFHEFGHGLHGMLSNVRYERLAGTSVLRDFVELPSQIFEHWAEEREVLKKHARHVDTGAPIPDALIDRLQAAAKFNQGMETVEYTACTLVDLALHECTEFDDLDIDRFEQEQLARIGMPADVRMRHRLPHFLHLFAGSSYASGYYVYLWAEVLDADAFEAFREAGSSFDPAIAKRLHDCVYSVGNSVEPGATFRAFRGRDPKVEPMLRQRGLM